MDTRLMRPIRASPKPLLLKDHLLDDMSSCSSNGFKSFPRRQCCTTAAVFLHDSGRRNKLPPPPQHQRKTYVGFAKPPPTSARSALQSVITAVKRLQFGGAKSPEKKKKKSDTSSFLPRSFSKRIFGKGGFWKRKAEQKEIERWKSFDQLLKEDSQPSDRSNGSITTTDDSKSYSWSGSDFTASDGGNSSAEVNLNLSDVKNGVVELEGDKASDHGVGVTNDDVLADSTTSSDIGSSDTNSSTETKNQWRSDPEKEEQLSPVCVLDCPFEDEDEDEEVSSSPFQHRFDRMEGTRKKLLKKIQRFECLATFEPINLTRRFASQPESDDDSPLPHSPTSIEEEEELQQQQQEEDEEEEEKAIELLAQVKASMPSYGLKLKADKLILDFFRETIASDHQHCTSTLEKQWRESSFYDELVEIAEDWINGQKPRKMFMEWKVEKNRQVYVEDMEKGGEWKIFDQENEEVVLELENEVFAALLNEMMLDII